MKNTTTKKALDAYSDTYQVLLFASLKDAAGKGQMEIAAAENIAVRELLQACARQCPALSPWLPHLRVAVNCEYVDENHRLHPGDEIALLPPVSGGA